MVGKKALFLANVWNCMELGAYSHPMLMNPTLPTHEVNSRKV